jgi:hypothetical protein
MFEQRDNIVWKTDYKEYGESPSIFQRCQTPVKTHTHTPWYTHIHGGPIHSHTRSPHTNTIPLVYIGSYGYKYIGHESSGHWLWQWLGGASPYDRVGSPYYSGFNTCSEFFRSYVLLDHTDFRVSLKQTTTQQKGEKNSQKNRSRGRWSTRGRPLHTHYDTNSQQVGC